MKRKILLLSILTVNTIYLTGQKESFKDTISIYFQEIQANTNLYKDLWNLDLYGPILLVDPNTRRIFANNPDSVGALKQDGKLFTGILPDKINIANTAITWNGKVWAMIMLPLPEKRAERLDLLSHELFHRSQNVLGFPMKNSDNNHLDQKDGRVYLRLELEALWQALIAKTITETHNHLADALFFRKSRYSLFPDAKSSENLLELNEGLATYTGIMMSGRNDSEIIKYFESKLIGFQNYPTFVRSFAYITTPLYGFILGRSDKNWNKQINNDTNLTDYFLKSFYLSIPDNLPADKLNLYGFEKINSEETKREQEIKQRIAAFKTIFIEHPHFEIKLEKMNISFDPRNIMPLEGYGTVYPDVRVTDNWGILTVTGGALLSTKWDKIILSEPTLINADRVIGSGWILDLNKGYKVEKNNSDKNYYLRKE